MGESIQINMGDPASDFASLVGPYSVAGGIYDFSGTQENHAYHENQGPANGMKSAVSKAEIADWTRLWWDGQSDAWTTDAQFDASRKDEANPFKLLPIRLRRSPRLRIPRIRWLRCRPQCRRLRSIPWLRPRRIRRPCRRRLPIPLLNGVLVALLRFFQPHLNTEKN